MDIPTFFRVLARFRLLIAAAFALAIVLALLSYVRVDVNSGLKLKYRTNETWTSSTQLLVSENIFTYGSTTGGRGGGGDPQQRVVDEGRLVTLAGLYAKFVLGDGVRALMLRNGPIHGLLDAGPLPLTNSNDQFLPIVNIVGYGSSRAGAIDLADRAARALQRYIRQKQVADGIKPQSRVHLSFVKRSSPKLMSPRSKTLPVLVFLLVLAAGVGLAFVLENVRPLIHALPDAPPNTRDERRDRRNKRVG